MPTEESNTELTNEDVRFLRQLRAQAPDRRDVLAGIAGAAGGAGLAFGATGGASAAASTSDSDGDVGTPTNRVDVFGEGIDANSIRSKFENDKRVVGPGSNQFNTIQAAHNDLPSKGGKIEVTSQYNDANETFPISITKPVWVCGQGAATELDGGANTVFEVDGATNYVGDRQKFARITNLTIAGGNTGIKIQNATLTRVEHVLIEDVSGTGIAIANDTNSSNSCLFFDVSVVNAGGNPVALDSAADPHHTRFIACNFDKNSGDVIPRGRGTLLYGCQIQDNGGRLKLDDDTVRVRECYFEDNDSGNTADVNITGGDGHVIEGCRFQGVTTNDRAVNCNGGTNTTLKNCSYQQYSSGFVNISASSNDADIHEPTHNAEDATAFLVGDSGTRTRSMGVIGGGQLAGVDLGTVNGQFDGDRAIADGTNASASEGDLAWWDAGNTQWLVWNSDATV